MTGAAVRDLVGEAERALRAARGARASGFADALGVSGVLADQLARELGRDAEQGAVRVLDAPAPGIAVAVRVVAGEPTDEDESFVAACDRAHVPVVLVQLWPQADWAPPFVLTPFVVECRAGEGFPVEEIASRIAEAAEHAPALAAPIPALRGAVTARAVRTAVVRAALLGLRAGSRPLITLEQLRLAADLRTLAGRSAELGSTASSAATAGTFLAAGFALRALARSARSVLPSPAADATVAAAGTWALAQALRRLVARPAERLPSGVVRRRT